MNFSLNFLKNYRYWIILSLIISCLFGFFPDGPIIPVAVALICMSSGMFLVSLFTSREDHIFLTNIFILAFLLRILAATFLYNFVYLLNGLGYFGDARSHVEITYNVYTMWLLGVESFSAIRSALPAAAIGGYHIFNTFVYFLTGSSPLSLAFINCLAGSVIIVFVYQMTKQLYDVKAARFAAILTAFWPSLFFWSIQTLKEPISIFLICALMWSFFRFKKQFRFYLIFLIIALTIALKEFRGIVLLVAYMAIIPASLIVFIWKSKKVELIFLFVLFLFAGILLFGPAVAAHITESLPIVKAKSGVSLLEWFSIMRKFRTTGGSAFLGGWDFTNLWILPLFLPVAIFVAWLAPFPWQLGSMMKIASMPEMLLYYAFLPLVFSGLRFIIKNKISEGIIMAAYIFIMALILAFVEGNIGTLFRHRSLILPFIFVLIGIGWQIKAKKKLSCNL